MVENHPDGCIYPDILMRIRPKASVDPDFLVIVWNSQVVRDQIANKAKTTVGTLKLNQHDVATMRIPLPPLLEQQKIAGRILGIERSEEENGRVLIALQDTKRGLMQDLLTGRVRVGRVACGGL
jgi:type I restriction enzyme S subunit